MNDFNNRGAFWGSRINYPFRVPGGNGFIDCGCHDFPAQPCGPFFPPVNANGCPFLVDTACTIYHLYKTTPSALINLNLPNGTRLQLILETIDAQLGQLNVNNWSLPFLRSLFTITTLQGFGQSVDAELQSIQNQINAIVSSNVTVSPETTPSITTHVAGGPAYVISSDVNLSASSGNTLSILSDGLYNPPQTLSIDYNAGTLSISNGNTVDFAPFLCRPSGFLGDLVSDPNPSDRIDGNYWYVIGSDQLRIQLNGAIRVITIT